MKKLTTLDLKILLIGQKIKLDCGHEATPGQNLASTIIIVSLGGGRIKVVCSEWGY